MTSKVASIRMAFHWNRASQAQDARNRSRYVTVQATMSARLSVPNRERDPFPRRCSRPFSSLVAARRQSSSGDWRTVAAVAFRVLSTITKGFGTTKGAWNINFVERFSKPFTRIGNPGYKTRSHFSSPFKIRCVVPVAHIDCDSGAVMAGSDSNAEFMSSKPTCE